jgi:small subunit ribosomal protein S15
MARIHARTKGKSGSTHPMREKHPEWSSLNPREIEGRILELAKAEKSTSEIGMILRDQYAVPDVKIATGKTITQILEQNKITQEIPEDLQNLIKTALKLKKHIDQHKKDFKTKRSLSLTESKIRRLMKYYRREQRLPVGWKYSLEHVFRSVEYNLCQKRYPKLVRMQHPCCGPFHLRDEFEWCPITMQMGSLRQGCFAKRCTVQGTSSMRR